MTHPLRQQLLAALETEWATYTQRFHNFPPEMQTAFLLRQGFSSLAELMAHITAWWTDGSRMIEYLVLDPTFMMPEYDVDEFNALAVDAVTNLNEELVIEIFETMRHKMVELVSNLSEEAFDDKKIADRLYVEVIGHYQEHVI